MVNKPTENIDIQSDKTAAPEADSKKGNKLTRALTLGTAGLALATASCKNDNDAHFNPGGSLSNQAGRMWSPGDTHPLDTKISDDHESAPENREVEVDVVVKAQLRSELLQVAQDRITELQAVKTPDASQQAELASLTAYEAKLEASSDEFITELYTADGGKATKNRIEQGIQDFNIKVGGEVYDASQEVNVKKVEQMQGPNGTIQYKVTVNFMDDNNGTNIQYDAVLRGEATVKKDGGVDEFRLTGVDQKRGLELDEISGSATKTSGSKKARIYKTSW